MSITMNTITMRITIMKMSITIMKMSTSTIITTKKAAQRKA